MINTPIGPLVLVGDDTGLQKAYFGELDKSEELQPEKLSKVKTQLEEYFQGLRTTFELNLNPDGTPFQRRVWTSLLDIPFGKTKSYQEIANNLGDPKVIRAAASANGKNPIAIIIPCHRVIGSDGSLTGYAGGLHRKQWLLKHESPITQIELF